MRGAASGRRMMLTAGVAVVVALLAGCVGSGDSGGGASNGTGSSDDPNTLRILAGSEVKDMIPILTTAASEIGVKVVFDYEGTLAGTEQVASGEAAKRYDATWFPNNRYLALLPGANAAISESVKIMTSPVVLGLKPAVAKKLGWDVTAPTWADLARAAGQGEFSYGMTNPAASNSGFSALVAVATALSGTGSALTSADITSVTPAMTKFFSAQKLTAGSSGFLADKFTKSPQLVDGIINYESVLKGITVDGQPLTIVTPTDGVVTSDYPLTLLTTASSAKKKLFDKLTAWLTTPKIQKRIASDVHRRPGIPGVDTGNEFGSTVLFETPFPNTLQVANALISTYLESARNPAQAIFLLDTSGSMEGNRLDALKKALTNLAGADTSTIGSFSSFRPRERITLLPFNTAPGTPQVFDLPDGDTSQQLAAIRSSASELVADGDTAIYSTLRAGYKLAVKQKAERPDTFVSVVLMTDGENTTGISQSTFTDYYRSLGSSASAIPTYVVLFGDGDVSELTEIAKLTGGQVFDALNGNLAEAFQEIRGYQ